MISVLERHEQACPSRSSQSGSSGFNKRFCLKTIRRREIEEETQCQLLGSTHVGMVLYSKEHVHKTHILIKNQSETAHRLAA